MTIKLSPSSVDILENAIDQKIQKRGVKHRLNQMAQVTRVDSDGTAWCMLPGSSIETPLMYSGATFNVGDYITVSIAGGSVSAFANMTSPEAMAKTLQDIIAKIQEQQIAYQLEYSESAAMTKKAVAEVRSIANEALAGVDEAEGLIATVSDQLELEIDAVETVANSALTGANEAKASVVTAKAELNQSISEVRTTANSALTGANEAKASVVTAKAELNQSISEVRTTAGNAQTAADAANTLAGNAQTTANTANATATTALQTANIGTNPNLSPFYSWPMGATNYWANKIYPYTTTSGTVAGTVAGVPMSEGWAHFSLANPGSTSTYCNCWTIVQPHIPVSTKHTFLIEIRNLTFASGSNIIVQCTTSNATTSRSPQFTNSGGQSITQDGKYYKTVTSKASFDACKQFTDGYIQFPPGVDVSFDIRLSLYEGEYTGAYKPYVDSSDVESTRSHFWHDSLGAHVGEVERLANASGAGYNMTMGSTADTVGIVLQNNASLLASFTPTALNFYQNGSINTAYTSDGVLIGQGGKLGSAHTANGLTIFDQSINISDYASKTAAQLLAATLGSFTGSAITIGKSTDPNISVTSSGITLKRNAVFLASFTPTALSFYQNGSINTAYTADGILIGQGGKLGSAHTSSGLTIFDRSINISDYASKTAAQLLAATLGSFTGSAITIGKSTAPNISVTSSGITLKNGASNTLASFTASALNFYRNNQINTAYTNKGVLIGSDNKLGSAHTSSGFTIFDRSINISDYASKTTAQLLAATLGSFTGSAISLGKSTAPNMAISSTGLVMKSDASKMLASFTASALNFYRDNKLSTAYTAKGALIGEAGKMGVSIGTSGMTVYDGGLDIQGFNDDSYTDAEINQHILGIFQGNNVQIGNSFSGHITLAGSGLKLFDSTSVSTAAYFTAGRSTGNVPTNENLTYVSGTTKYTLKFNINAISKITSRHVNASTGDTVILEWPTNKNYYTFSGKVLTLTSAAVSAINTAGAGSGWTVTLRVVYTASGAPYISHIIGTVYDQLVRSRIRALDTGAISMSLGPSSALSTVDIIKGYATGTTDGINLLISGNGNTLIGAGESAQNAYNIGIGSDSGEQLYLLSDNSISFLSNANTIANRKTMIFNTSGQLNVPGTIYQNGTAVALSGHTHSYLPLSGGTLTGMLDIPSSELRIGYPAATNGQLRLYGRSLLMQSTNLNYQQTGTATTANGNAMISFLDDDGDSGVYIHARRYMPSGAGNPSFGIEIGAGSNNMSGSASSAVYNALGIYVDGDGVRRVTVSETKSWRIALGSTPAGVWPISLGGTGATSANAAARALGMAKTKGDTLTLNGLVVDGYLTSSKTSIVVCIQTAYRFYSATTATVSASGRIRQNNTYIVGSGSADASISATVNVVNVNGFVTLSIPVTAPTAAINNDPVAVHFSALTITLAA